MKIDDVYHKMIEAANRAAEASKEYKEEDARVESRVTGTRNFQNSDALSRVRIMDQEKDHSEILAKVFNRYKFWKGEQERLGSLLQAHAAYVYCEEVARRQNMKALPSRRYSRPSDMYKVDVYKL